MHASKCIVLTNNMQFNSFSFQSNAPAALGAPPLTLTPVRPAAALESPPPEPIHPISSQSNAPAALGAPPSPEPHAAVRPGATLEPYPPKPEVEVAQDVQDDSFVTHGRRCFPQEEASLLLKLCKQFVDADSFKIQSVITHIKSTEEGMKLYGMLQERFEDNTNKKIADRIRAATRTQKAAALRKNKKK